MRRTRNRFDAHWRHQFHFLRPSLAAGGTGRGCNVLFRLTIHAHAPRLSIIAQKNLSLTRFNARAGASAAPGSWSSSFYLSLGIVCLCDVDLLLLNTADKDVVAWLRPASSASTLHICMAAA